MTFSGVGFSSSGCFLLIFFNTDSIFIDLDTTKLKARQFARTSGPVNKGDNNLWTETPAERQQRIADEVAGKKRRAVDVANEEALGVGSSSKKRSKREEESIKKGVDEYTVRFSLSHVFIFLKDLMYLSFISGRCVVLHSWSNIPCEKNRKTKMMVQKPFGITHETWPWVAGFWTTTNGIR